MVRTRLAAAVAAATLAAGCAGSHPPPAPARTPAPSPTTAASTPARSAAAPSRSPSVRPVARSAWCGWAARPAPVRHVVWVWMENHSYDAVIGAPFINLLAARCGLATNYHSVAHPSLPNYLAAVAGTTFGVSSDCGPQECPQPGPTLFSQLDAVGRPWRAYAESMSVPCQLTSGGDYAAKHNPAVYFPALRASCQHSDLPLPTPLPAPFPAFTMVTPNLCNDTHDCPTDVGDAWLRGFVTRLLASADYRSGTTVLLVTWDEGEGNDHVATLVVGPATVPGTRAGGYFTHYSLLRTTEQLLGLPPLRQAAAATSMVAAFRL